MTQKPNKIAQLKQYLQHDMWQIRLANQPPKKARQIRILRILVLIGEKFQKNNLAHAASAMTFFTLLSIVPILAMIFGIAKYFISEKDVEKFIQDGLQGQENTAEKIIEYANSALANSQGGLIAGLGFVMLAYSAFKLLSNIEIIFNTIWQIDKPRTIIRKVVDYLTLTVLSPVVIILVQVLNIIGASIHEIAQKYEITPELTILISFLTNLLPYTFLWFLFTILYLVMPHAKVKFKYAFLGGVFAGSAYQLVQWIYLEFQIGVSGANAIYGSFAALPLFLAQLQLGWTLILVGCLLAYVAQNVHQFERYTPAYRVRESENKILIATILAEINRYFQHHKTALTVLEIAQKTDIPIRYVENMITLLVEHQILAQADAKIHKEKGYQPIMDADKLTLHFVHQMAENFGDEPFKIENKDYHKLKELSHKLSLESQNSEANISLTQEI